jgi:3-oxoadipate enol-lactonase
MVADYSGWHWHNDDPRFPGDLDAIHRLSEISAATTILVGENDLPDFHEIARVLSNDIYGAHVECLPDAGHLVNLEAAAVCNTLLRAHLEA